MTIYTPRKSQASFGEESSYGSKAPSVNTYLGKINPLSQEFRNNLMRYSEVRETTETSNLIAGNIDIKFPITFGLMNGRFLKFVLGSCDDVGESPTTHTITAENDAYLPSITLNVVEKATVNEIYDFLGTVFESVTISWKKASVVEVSANLISQDVDDTASSVPDISYPADEPFKFSNVSVEVNGSSLITNSGSVTITNNHLAEGKCDESLGRKIAQPQKGEVQYSISANFDKKDTSVFGLWKNITNHTIVIKFSRGVSDYVELTFTNCKLDVLTEPVDLGANVIVSDGTWFSKNLSVEAKDDIASY